jgi:DNA-binding transcriptional MerR regulator
MRPNDTATMTLAELATMADVTPRTVRYYVQQSLLPSPGSGPRARYGRPHLTRIRLIKRLQKQDVPLAKIRSALESLDDAGVERLLSTLRTEPGQETSQLGASMSAPAVEYIRGVLEGRSSVPLGRHLPHVPESNPSAPPPARPPQLTRSQWERLPLSPDVELHIRRPMSRHQNKQVDRLITFAIKLFEEDTP